ncbi:syntaxin-11-like [Halichoeres trimaculatus]|uniref:syntaxin-11-like n=1 Tax=Halichoeres trimaculatus TaxID=147232 RepID=UPI003D9DB95C
MRDMLERLQTISEEQEDYEPDFYGPEYDVDKVTLSQEAVVFDELCPLERILEEASDIRKDISRLELQVERLRANNERFGTSMRRLTLLKKDSDSIARGIQQHGEALYSRLQALSKECAQFEEKDPNCAVSRVARVQYDTLTRAFHAVMHDYSEAEEMQRKTCRGRIQRQASILGTDISDEQLDVLVDKGGEGWGELSQSLQAPGARTSHRALCDIRGRHKELVELEVRLKEVHELFLQMALLVEEQGYQINHIESHVCKTEEYTERVNDHIKRALQCKRKNPFLQCCPCFSCWSHKRVF